MLGLNSVDCAEVVTAVVSVFWVDSDGLEKENRGGAVKGLRPDDSTEPEPFCKMEAGLSAVDDAGGKKMGFGNSGTGGVVVAVSVLGIAYAGFENMDEEEVEAKGDDEGPTEPIDETAGLSAESV